MGAFVQECGRIGGRRGCVGRMVAEGIRQAEVRNGRGIGWSCEVASVLRPLLP